MIRCEFRYFLGCRPHPRWYAAFQRIAEEIGQPVRLEHVHLTLCTVAETMERERFLLGRVRRALRDAELLGFPVNLSRVVAGRNGAEARTYGRQEELQTAYRHLIGLLAAVGIEPLHRQSGMRPHVTLSHQPCAKATFPISIPWVADELLLIESEQGKSKHNVLARWQLSAPRQGLLPFDEKATAAADPVRRSAA